MLVFSYEVIHISTVCYPQVSRVAVKQCILPSAFSKGIITEGICYCAFIRAFFLSWRVKHGIANQPFKWQEVQKTIKNQQNPAPTELSSFTCTSETFPYTFEGWLQYIPCRALYSKFLLLVWHRLNLLIFRACKLQLIYYASCCGGGPLGKLCVWESRFWYSASTLGLFSDFMSRLLESWIGTFSV